MHNSHQEPFKQISPKVVCGHDDDMVICLNDAAQKRRLLQSHRNNENESTNTLGLKQYTLRACGCINVPPIARHTGEILTSNFDEHHLFSSKMQQ